MKYTIKLFTGAVRSDLVYEITKDFNQARNSTRSAAVQKYLDVIGKEHSATHAEVTTCGFTDKFVFSNGKSYCH